MRRNLRQMRLRVLVVAGGAALAVAACGSAQTGDESSPSTRPTSSAPAHTVAVTPTVPGSDTATTLTVTTSPASGATVSTATITQPDSGGAGLTTVTTAAAAQCTAADLTAAAVPPNGATGTVVLGFTLKNTSAQACGTYGWPGIAFVDAAGSAVATQSTRTTADILGSTPPIRFTLPPAGEASFRITVHDSNDQGGEAGCGSYRTVQIIAPDDTATMRVTLPDGPAEVCGAAAISPLEPGTSATGQ
jgi:hypothetical protein